MNSRVATNGDAAGMFFAEAAYEEEHPWKQREDDAMARPRETMMDRTTVDFTEIVGGLYRRQQTGKGLLLTSGDVHKHSNVMTVGWGLYGCAPAVVAVAVRPACYTHDLLDAADEFVLCVPTEDIEDAVAFCGEKSGRGRDKFRECGLTATPSMLVRPPSIAQCAITVECCIYSRQRPPHVILPARYREVPLEEQHTIYFGEVVGAFARRQ